MNIFNEKTVVALFDNDKEAGDAISLLQEHGFGETDEDEIKIVDQTRLGQETPVDQPDEKVVAPPTTGSSGTSGAMVPDTAPQSLAEGSQSAMVEESAREVLEDLGLGDEEAGFYARHVGRGSVLVIVETSQERAGEALELLKETNARASAT